jgi:hypothetical protein
MITSNLLNLSLPTRKGKYDFDQHIILCLDAVAVIRDADPPFVSIAYVISQGRGAMPMEYNVGYTCQTIIHYVHVACMPDYRLTLVAGW